MEEVLQEMDNIEKRNRSQTEEDVQLLSEKKKTPAESRLSNQGCCYTFNESSLSNWVYCYNSTESSLTNCGYWNITTLLRVGYPIRAPDKK